MKQQHDLQSKASTHQDEKELGISMAPPQFKLTAGAEDTSGNAGGQRTGVEESVDSIAGGPQLEQVSNFGRMADEVVMAANKGDISGVMLSIEAIKHDQAEWNEFKTYFLSKKKIDLQTFLGGKLGNEMVLSLFRNLDADMSKIPAGNVAALINESIAENNATAVMSLLIAYSSPKDIAAAYTATYPGQDMRTDLQAMCEKAPALKAFLDNFYGDRKNNERVKVNSPAEATEARAIIARLYDVYGVDVNSQKVVDEVRKWTPDAPTDLLKGVNTAAWTMSELQDLEFGLSKFAPIAGANRKNSSRASNPQEVKTAARLNHRLEKDSEDNYRPTSHTGGTYSPNSQSFMIMDGDPSLRKSGKTQKNAQGKEVAVQDGNRMVITHELSHGFMKYALPEFEKRMSLWAGGPKVFKTEWETIELPNGTRKVIRRAQTTHEVPPTMYGLKDAWEDFADSVAMYFNNPLAMKNGSVEYRQVLPFADPSKGQIIGAPCPERYAFIAEKIAEWRQR
jgi:hypothetical protein